MVEICTKKHDMYLHFNSYISMQNRILKILFVFFKYVRQIIDMNNMKHLRSAIHRLKRIIQEYKAYQNININQILSEIVILRDRCGL